MNPLRQFGCNRAFVALNRAVATLLLLTISGSFPAHAASIRAVPNATLSPASYWGTISSTNGGKIRETPKSNCGFSMSFSNAYVSHELFGWATIFAAPRGSARAKLSAGGEAGMNEPRGAGLADGFSTIDEVLFDFKFATNPNFPNPPTTIPGRIEIPHSLAATGHTYLAYGSASFLFVLTKVSPSGQRTVLVNAEMKLASHIGTKQLVISGLLARDPAFVASFESVSHQEFPLDFEPDTKYQVQMRISGAATVSSNPKEVPSASFYVRADPGLELADDGVPYADAFDLQVSPALMAPPHLNITQGLNALELYWQGKPGEFVLQSCQSLAEAAWQPIAVEIRSEGYQQSAQLPSPPATTWFRLIEPM